MATSDDLELSAKNMQKYIGGLAVVKTMVCMLQDELDKGSATLMPQSLSSTRERPKTQILSHRPAYQRLWNKIANFVPVTPGFKPLF